MRFSFAFLFVCIFMMTSAPVSTAPIVLASGNYPPWTTETPPHYGFVNRLVTEAFATQNVEVEFEFFPWKRSYMEALVGRANGTSFWYRDERHDEEFFTSKTMLVQKEVLFYVQGTVLPDWQSLRDLTTLRFGATQGYSYIPEFWDMYEAGQLDVQLAIEDLISFKKLMVGRIDVFPCEEVRGWQLLREHFSEEERSRVMVSDKPLHSAEVTLLFPKSREESQILLNQFNLGLEVLTNTGRKEQLWQDLLNGVY